MAALVRRLRLGELAQAVGGLAFGMSGYIAARGWFASINAAVVWLPWILLLAYDVVKRPRHQRPVTFLGIAIALQLLAGHAQLTWYTLLLTGAWMTFWAVEGALRSPQIVQSEATAGSAVETQSSGRAIVRRLLSAWGRFALAGLLAAALSAVQLLPTAEYLLQSQRSGAVDYEIAMTYSFWPWRFLDFVAPGLFGSPATGDFWGYATYWEDAVHIGLLPFLLAAGVLIGAVLPRKRSGSPARTATPGRGQFRGLVLFLLGVIFVSFLLALGKNTPVFPWLYAHVPTFDMFKSPTRYSIWAIFALSLLAAVGTERWRRPTGRGLYWTRLATMGAFAVMLGAGLGWYALRGLPDFHISFVRALTLTGLFGLGVGALALTAPAPESSPRWAGNWGWAVILFVAADLLVANWGLNPGIALDFYTQPPGELRIAILEKTVGDAAMVGETQASGRVYLPLSDEDSLRYDRYFVFETFDPGLDWDGLRAARLPNLNLLEGIPYVNNYDPMVPGRYARWMEYLDGEGVAVLSGLPLLDLMGVTVLEAESPDAAFGVTFTPRGDAAARRVRWLPCARPARDAESAWDAVTSGTVDLGAVVILEDASPPQISDCSAHAGTASLQGTENPSRVLIHTQSEYPGWVLLSDVWYPGWGAAVDGEPVPVLRADYLFRAVEVPAGAHTVEFGYRPRSFWGGLGVSLLALLGLGIAWGWRRKKDWQS